MAKTKDSFEPDEHMATVYEGRYNVYIEIERSLDALIKRQVSEYDKKIVPSGA